MKSLIQSFEVSYLVHSTESQERLEGAVKGALRTDAEAEVQELEGHFRNKILRVTYRLAGGAASSTFDNLLSGLSSAAKHELVQRLGDMMDEHMALYLRLDKQSLIAGRLTLGGDESVRVRVKPRLFLMKGGAAEFYRRALEGGR